MPIDANYFNDPAIDLFFNHVSGCAMTHEEFAAIKLEGILDPSDLEDLDEEDLGNTFKKIHCTPPTVTAGVSAPVQGINVSGKSQKISIIVYREARNYESVSCDLKTAMIKWKVLNDLDFNLTALKDKKN